MALILSRPQCVNFLSVDILFTQAATQKANALDRRRLGITPTLTRRIDI